MTFSSFFSTFFGASFSSSSFTFFKVLANSLTADPDPASSAGSRSSSFLSLEMRKRYRGKGITYQHAHHLIRRNMLRLHHEREGV